MAWQSCDVSVSQSSWVKREAAWLFVVLQVRLSLLVAWVVPYFATLYDIVYELHLPHYFTHFLLRLLHSSSRSPSLIIILHRPFSPSSTDPPFTTRNLEKMDDTRLHNIRRQIESNDPKLNKLTISDVGLSDSYHPHDGDWERDGNGIGSNEHIKELWFGRTQNVIREKFEAFCRGIACNKSISILKISCCALFDGDIFNLLTPFFEQNINLRSLTLDIDLRSLMLDGLPNAVRLLSASLTRFNTLREFECSDNDLLDNE